MGGVVEKPSLIRPPGSFSALAGRKEGFRGAPAWTLESQFPGPHGIIPGYLKHQEPSR